MKSLIVVVLILFGPLASAALTKTYRITFRGDYGYSAENAKYDTVDRLPAIFSRYVRDVKWKIRRQGKAWIQVDLTGENKNRIDGWLYTIQAETQDAIAGITEVK